METIALLCLDLWEYQTSSPGRWQGIVTLAIERPLKLVPRCAACLS